ncbi:MULTISPECIES: acyltransferase [unclassified Gilliamella]|uniref:acyltransferase n=1 Tax=unclassified Gilliamella TaxID=2685620 RepID=UPI0004611213
MEYTVKNINVDGYYSDNKGNLVFAPKNLHNVTVNFVGNNNKLIIADTSNIHNINFDFPSHNAVILIGENGNLSGQIRAGYHCYINIGDNVTCTNKIYITSAEKTKIIIGDDCMFSTGNQIRSDDAHAIYDVNTGKRVNKSKDIIIGEHVWFAFNSVVLSGGQIGEGSVVGFASIVKGKYLNNCIIVGSPARSTKHNIAWERPNVMLCEPWIRNHQNQIKSKKEYWNKTIKSKPIYVGQGVFHNIHKLNPFEDPIDKTKHHPYVELYNIFLQENKIYLKGIAAIIGIPCPEYSPCINNYLLFINENSCYSKQLAKFSDPNISRKLFNGDYISYDKAGMSTFRNEGLSINDIPDGTYKLEIKLTFNKLEYYSDLKSEDFKESFYQNDELILKLYVIQDIVYFEKTTKTLI